MRVWKVPSSAHWDAGGARTLDELLARVRGAGIKPEPPAGNEADSDDRGRGGDGGKATREQKQKQKKRKRRDRGGEEEEEEMETVAVKEEVQ